VEEVREDGTVPSAVVLAGRRGHDDSDDWEDDAVPEHGGDG
jgi:hypothetical protein